jgi:hypothetical protein
LGEISRKDAKTRRFGIEISFLSRWERTEVRAHTKPGLAQSTLISIFSHREKKKSLDIAKVKSKRRLHARPMEEWMGKLHSGSFA